MFQDDLNRGFQPLSIKCRRLFQMPLAAWLILAVSAEYAFDVKACKLCYWQRARTFRSDTANSRRGAADVAEQIGWEALPDRL